MAQSKNRKGPIETFRLAAERPSLFARGEPLFWNDPHISSQMLKAHLDPEIDAASRKHETIDRSVDWLVSTLGLQSGAKVLDLGCGPGLYCTRFAQRGLRVTGVDHSRRSIEYARFQARTQGLSIDYRLSDYLTLDFRDEFEAVFLIYCDFGALSDGDRDNLLARVYLALKPGGRFVFDVWTPRFVKAHEESRWEFQEGGFWSPDPYLCLYRRFHYPDNDAYCHQYTVLTGDAGARVYRVWDHVYTPATLSPVLRAAGLEIEAAFGNLDGTLYTDDSECLGVVCRRSG